MAPESDSRFPSGKWTGFFLQKEVPGKHQMELILSFADGVVTGEGRDRVGEFLIRGRYHIDDGKCHWTKRYVGKHDVFYHGYGEAKGIWGTWESPPAPTTASTSRAAFTSGRRGLEIQQVRTCERKPTFRPTVS